ncbi:MAG TPA: helix-turn-helix transcriptional regulator [Candidatus Elarobacter sp.]|nr:helix-turn-helix transcriptional regulator [Candidatus Elarobacter sp.]
MMFKHSSSHCPKRCNEHHRVAPVEPLSARIFRLRIARGYSVYELATAAGIFAGTIQRLESGKPVDKRVLPALATALSVRILDARPPSERLGRSRSARDVAHKRLVDDGELRRAARGLFYVPERHATPRRAGRPTA